MSKRIIVIILVISLLTVSFIGCAEVEEEQTAKGYAIIHHWDGDEHVEFYDYFTNYGNITIYATDGRMILSNNITLIFYEK